LDSRPLERSNRGERRDHSIREALKKGVAIQKRILLESEGVVREQSAETMIRINSGGEWFFLECNRHRLHLGGSGLLWQLPDGTETPKNDLLRESDCERGGQGHF
jgi:hypothetical protein